MQLLAKKANIQDVAKLAGVSIKTVSRVLNHEPKVRESTRGRVEAAMRELNYSPNSPARKLAGSRTYLLGLIYNANSSYITSIQNGALDACRGEHYDLLIHPCLYTDESLLTQIQELVTNPRVDGLLLTPPISDRPDVQELTQRLNVPNVVISRDSVKDNEWTVCTNDRAVCADMVRYLARLGHQRIAFVQGHPDHKSVHNRFEGFKDGLNNAGLKLYRSLIVEGQLTFESGIDCGLKLLRNKKPPTAIFCANDHMAAGVMKVAHEMGLSIPGDLSVAGFDDIPLASQIWPQLTTVRQPLHEMSRLAAKTLIRHLRGDMQGDRSRMIPAQLVLRESTGPAPIAKP